VITPLDTQHAAGAEFVEYALALLDLGSGRWSEALDRLGSLRDTSLRTVSLPDRVEAAMRIGRPDEARAAVEAFADDATGGEPRWMRARLATARALVADGDAAARAFEEALELIGDMHPFECGRIHLLYGEHLRRRRRRREAREHLRVAVRQFTETYAEPWLNRAQRELDATAETARKRHASTIDQLTPQERQISRYVAQGLRNKEVAARLFLSPRTIEYHLRNVFSKLGIDSRAQLARLEFDADRVGLAAQALSASGVA
jgi:DNA-binding CsgD family transcriptional regulator